MKYPKDRTGSGLMAAGLLLLAAALFLTLHNVVQGEKAGKRAAEIARQLVEQTESERSVDFRAVEQAAPVVEVVVEENGYLGVLEIPALGLSLPVMETWSEENLKQSPCRYLGSAYGDDLILAAHNYRRHFGGLHRLKPGDEIRFMDNAGTVFSYAVAQTERLDGGAVEEMQAGNWALTLFTCTMDGRSRVTVRCERSGGT